MTYNVYYFGFETKDRKPVKVPYGIMTDHKYFLLEHESQNVKGAGVYKEVSRNEFINRK